VFVHKSNAGESIVVKYECFEGVVDANSIQIWEAKVEKAERSYSSETASTIAHGRCKLLGIPFCWNTSSMFEVLDPHVVVPRSRSRRNRPKRNYAEMEELELPESSPEPIMTTKISNNLRQEPKLKSSILQRIARNSKIMRTHRFYETYEYIPLLVFKFWG